MERITPRKQTLPGPALDRNAAPQKALDSGVQPSDTRESAQVATVLPALPPFVIDRNDTGGYANPVSMVEVSLPETSLIYFLRTGEFSPLNVDSPEMVASMIEEVGLHHALRSQFFERAARRQLCADLRRYIEEVEKDEARREASEPVPALPLPIALDEDDDRKFSPKSPEDVARNQAIAEELIADMGKLLNRVRGTNGWIIEHVTNAYTDVPSTKFFHEDDGRVESAFGKLIFAEVEVHPGKSGNSFDAHSSDAFELAAFLMMMNPVGEEDLMHLAAVAVHRARIASQEGGAA